MIYSFFAFILYSWIFRSVLFRLGKCAIFFSSFATTDSLFCFCVCRISDFIHRVFQTFLFLYFEFCNLTHCFTWPVFGWVLKLGDRIVLYLEICTHFINYLNYSDFSLFTFCIHKLFHFLVNCFLSFFFLGCFLGCVLVPRCAGEKFSVF